MFYYWPFINMQYIIILLPAVLIALYAQIKMQATFSKYSKIESSRRITGADVAMRVLTHNDVVGVNMERAQGNLGDHFDSSTNTIRLSDQVYARTSIAAVGIAAHEAGHAVQNSIGYKPMKFRKFIVPIANIGSKLAMPLVLIGLLLPVQYSFILNLGIIFFSFSVLFQLVTLPVEINASRRALKALEESHTLYDDEIVGAKKVLMAAALTYLAATISAVLSLLRLILIAGSRRGD